MILISQDGLKAIDKDKIQFFAINPEANGGGTFKLLAKTPTIDNNFYDYLILFEHENIEVVKATLKFLLAFQLVGPDDFILHVDLDSLYKCGMKVAPELLNSDFKQGEDSAE